MVEDRLQHLDSSTCGIFQLHFYDNLLNPKENSKIQSDKKLTKRTVETLLNELFTHDNQDSNEQKNGVICCWNRGYNSIIFFYLLVKGIFIKIHCINHFKIEYIFFNKKKLHFVMSSVITYPWISTIWPYIFIVHYC